MGRGQIRYVGSVETKRGVFVGIDLFAGNGKNDGTFGGRRYFETSFPRSGLFIQWEKVVNLIPRRSNPDISMTMQSSSPTPVRKNTRSENLQGSIPKTIPESRSQSRVSNGTPTMDHLGQGSSNIARLETELLQYKRLVEDQRIVFEEIQAAIDEYESKLDAVEREKGRVQNQLDHERASYQRQKQFYENEHDQLLTVIDELQTEINRNAAILAEIMQKEKRFDLENDSNMLSENQTSQENPGDDGMSTNDLQEQILELQQIKAQSELQKVKYENENKQLQFQNESLSKETQKLSNELADYQRKQHDIEARESVTRKELEDARNRIQILEAEAKESSKRHVENVDLDDRMDSLPLYDPTSALKSPLNNAAAGRSLWCALCEKDGHESVDCPYDDKFF